MDINITNNECMYMRWISDWIFIWCMLGSGRLLMEYSFGVCRDLADYQPNIHSVYEWIRRIANWIFSWCMQGSSGLLTKYSFDVWMGQVDFWPNIYLVYAGIRWITNWIFNSQNNQIKWVKFEYSIVRMIGLGGSEYSIVGMIRLGGSEFNI